MTLEQCTKEELIYIVNLLADKCLRNKEYYINHCLNIIQQKRREKLLLEADKWNCIELEKRREYIDILARVKNGERSIKILKEAKKVLDEAEYADKQYEKIMRRVECNG